MIQKRETKEDLKKQRRLLEVFSNLCEVLFREHDKWGYILIHDGKQIVCNYSVKLLGGTPNGRVPNEDDIEPLIALNKKNIVWGN